jgi:hypothetical protein
MPRFDGTGPEAAGPMTGRGFGWCIRDAREFLAQRELERGAEGGGSWSAAVRAAAESQPRRIRRRSSAPTGLGSRPRSPRAGLPQLSEAKFEQALQTAVTRMEMR